MHVHFCIQYHFGAMIYNEEEGKGIRNSKIHPQKFKLFSTATMEDILNMGREAFFSELDPPIDTLHLANSSGQIIDADSENWTLGKYFEENGYQPSRHKLYIVYRPQMVSGYVVSHNFIYILGECYALLASVECARKIRSTYGITIECARKIRSMHGITV